jgi:hypothetical protein
MLNIEFIALSRIVFFLDLRLSAGVSFLNLEFIVGQGTRTFPAEPTF